MQYLVGVDVGTSSCKVAMFDETFELKSFAQCGYALNAPRPGWIEFDSLQIWNALCESVRAALSRLEVDLIAHSFCVAFSVFGEGLIITDDGGRPVYPGILSSDVRSAGIADRMDREIGRDVLFERTGRFPHPMSVVTKIIWARECLPRVVNRRTRFLDVASWLFNRLGAGWVTDHSIASGTMLFDIDPLAWAPDLLAYAGIGAEVLPASVQAGTSLGSPSDEAAKALGFPAAANVSLVVGAMDQMCNAVGTGTVAPGRSSAPRERWKQSRRCWTPAPIPAS